MKFNGMEQFTDTCRNALMAFYNEHIVPADSDLKLGFEDTFIVWSCRTLQNYKCLASTTVPGDGIYAEYTYNGDKEELYEDIYAKISNQAYE